MKKIINEMGEIEFGRLYNESNRIINSLKDTPIINSSFVKTIPINQLKSKLNNDYIFNILEHRDEINIYKTDASNLLSKYRFDIYVKYNYVKSFIENRNLEENTQIYLAHIKAFNNFHEPDGKKNSAEEFLSYFNSLIKNIEFCGNLEKTILPISVTGNPIDGAHRISIALYLKLKVNYAVFDLLDGKYDENFFRKRGMPNGYIEKTKQSFKLF